MRGTPNLNARPAARVNTTATGSTNLPKGTEKIRKAAPAMARVVDLTQESSVVKPSVELGSRTTGSTAVSVKLEGAKRTIASDSQLPFKRNRLAASATPNLASETFPFFTKGTVEIVTSSTNVRYQYRLHRAVLERNSDWFRKSLSQPDDWHQEAEASLKSQGSVVRHTFVLLADASGGTHIVRKSTAAAKGLPDATSQSTGPARSMIGASPRTDVGSPPKEVKVETEQHVWAALTDLPGPDIDTLEAYNSLFLTFYNVSPTISSDDISKALSQCEKLLLIASDVGSLQAVRPHLNSALSQYRHRLFAAIAIDPPRWAKLAVALESSLIFTESIIHVVGCWPAWPWITSKEALDKEIKDLIAHKARILAEMRMNVNNELFLNTIKIGEGPKERTVAMKTSFETWIVVQFFRDWLANSIAVLKDDDDHSIITTHIGLLYRTILRGGDSYLPFAEIHPLLRDYGRGHEGLISSYGESEWEEAAEDLKLLKDYASGAVKEICKNNLMLDASHLGYLTCVDIRDEDLPWRKRAVDLGED